MAKRGYLTTAEKFAMLRAQHWRCACHEKCGRPLWPGAPVEFDHRPPLAFTGAAKPNQAVTPECHARLTKIDVRNIAKAKRIARRNGLLMPRPRRGRPIPTRRFAKAPPGYKHFLKPEKPA